MDLRDIFGANPQRPDHPDFWRLSEIILGLKASIEGKTPAEQEVAWKAEYEKIGDFDSIAYCAVQAAMQIHSINTAADHARMMRDGRLHQSYVGSVQAFFDGFAMGAEFMRGKEAAVAAQVAAAHDGRACIEAGEHLKGQRHRWQECPTYHDEEDDD